MDQLIGYWASQAVYVAAKLGLADHLEDSPLTAAELAVLTGSDEPSLARLLRFLIELDVLTVDADGRYHATESGVLLRTEEHGSMRDLALLYGEEFYSGWGRLLHTVRTGENGFESLHGAAMYPYFGQTPELTAKFDRAMAAGSAFFEPVPGLIDAARAHTVVDIAGGNGALLATVLRAHPQARGVLFDTEHVIRAAEEELSRTDVGARIDYSHGNYYEKVPTGGDVYLLSRVLHGRDDAKCLEVLARIRESIQDKGQLLIIERVIPEDGTKSLAAWFDVHMLTIAGGTERSTSQYRTLLEQAGFDLAAVHSLPLDTELLVAEPRER
ncbi:methyltransferase [Streptacidiphilus sp. 4-A2]|nr:methyltransferase [Streptacidiphilus sp. 4-A2]